MRIGRYRLGVYPTLRLEWRWRQREYWDRRILGPIYVLRDRRTRDGADEP